MMKRGYGVENFEKIVPDPYRFNTFGNLVEFRSVAGNEASSQVEEGKLKAKAKRLDVRIHSLVMQTREPGKDWVKASHHV
ncbi:MAG: hypothetical protein WCP06_06200 [Verrucomicrobiota bacterium]